MKRFPRRSAAAMPQTIHAQMMEVDSGAYIIPIDCDQLLHGKCDWKQVREFFKHQAFDSEHYLVEAIKKHLLTSTETTAMHADGFSIEDMLNGRVEGEEANKHKRVIFLRWNIKLGFTYFGK